MSIRSTRYLTLLLHALFFVAAAGLSAIVPLLPRLSHVYGLAPSASAVLLAAPGLATLAVSVPAGLLADRFGARGVTIAAAALLVAATLTEAVPSYPALVAGRIAFGFAYGILCTTAVAWLARAVSGAGAPSLGAVATSGAVGMVAGPALGGILADQFGLGAPFLVMAASAALLVAGMAMTPPPPPIARSEREASLREFARVASRHPGVITGATVLAVLGAVGGVIQLLLPQQLHAAGFSPAETGEAFSLSSGAYIVVSAAVIRLGHRASPLRLAAGGALLLSLSVLPAVFGVGATLLIVTLVVSTVPRAVVSTVAYPLATESAASAEISDSVVIGVLNGTWAIGLVVAPLLAGAVEQVGGASLAYLSAVIPGTLSAVWLLSRRPLATGHTGGFPALAGV